MIIKPPSKKQRLTLRLMILIGVGCMAFFAFYLLQPAARGYKPLYALLIITFAFTAAKVLYEWYHYWSIKIDKKPERKKIFTVDILTTFVAGEPYEMIVETLEAMQAITYPHTTYLCDEADDPYLKSVCQKLGVQHITRTVKKNAKAGNINNALQYAQGELCVVLDPDHAPFPDFLEPIVDHFNNPEIGFVQVVQAYANQDQGWIAKGAAQQTYQYYGPMMMTMNAYGTAQAIGANCTFRRSALDSIGGHAAGLAEDMHTSMQLHAKGWKSIYVPAVLSRGLVPATLSAYYQQQLKWSRGVFDLLVTSYPALFNKFTWRQKLHYGLVPMFYLSGFIYLLNFLIPIASLFADVYPLRMDFSVFAIVTVPFITSVILIRHFVQRWVMEDQERGFHVIGGLLLIGTWWVFIVGFVYTLMRKKVPYIPTPKDITEEKNLRINLPNLAVLGVSVAAILYGCYNDWNPFTLTMAGICAINCCFMVFMLLASEQHQVKTYQRRYRRLTKVSNNIGAFKRRFWLLRRRIYRVMRTLSLPLMLLSVFFAYYASSRVQGSDVPIAAPVRKNVLITGVFDPARPGSGLTDLSKIQAQQKRQSVKFSIISTYVAWGDGSASGMPLAHLDSIYKLQATPMITWEPWQNLFQAFSGKKDEKVFSNILAGKHDAYINRIAQQLRSLNRPVFLRFAHEADNPAYPWSATGQNTPEEFKAAWKYVRQSFAKQGTWNVIWVWNPWNPKVASNYFPGKNNLDWIGITGLNYGPYSVSGQSLSFRDVYMPFHRLKLNKLDIPVMIAEMGTVKEGTNQADWLNAGINSIQKQFKEVKAVVLFNSAFDQNVPNYKAKYINWQFANVNALKPFTKQPKWLQQPAAMLPNTTAKVVNQGFSANANGVLYAKGQNWYGNTYAITKQTILTDFKAMRRAGLNSVKLYGPGIYDRITLQAANETQLNVLYSFWVPEPSVWLADSTYLPKLSRKILETVSALKKQSHIKSWNIGNAALQHINYHYLQPELFYKRQAYVAWLKQLVSQIKAIDAERPVTVDIELDNSAPQAIAQLQDQVPGVSAYGLIWKNQLKDSSIIRHLPVPFYFSSIKPEFLVKYKGAKAATILENWQDQQSAAGVSFDGLIDVKGRFKADYCKLAKLPLLPEVKILRPSLPTVPGDVLPYNALVKTSGNWQLAQSLNSKLRFEWYQVRTDRWGTPLQMSAVGEGPILQYQVPQNPNLYRLYLVATNGQRVTTAYSILNIPFRYENARLEE